MLRACLFFLRIFFPTAFSRLHRYAGKRSIRVERILRCNLPHGICSNPNKSRNVMTDKQLNGLRVAILATDGFEEAELLEPRRALEAAGAKTTVVAPKNGKIQGMKHDEKSEKVVVDATFDNANPADFDAVLLPGGALNADALRVVRQAQQFVQEANNAHKPIAFICHAPWLLVSAGWSKR